LRAGFLLRRLQKRENMNMPRSRPLPLLGSHCHELQISDTPANWRIIYRVDPDAIMITEI